jgi:hypothetical protein
VTGASRDAERDTDVVRRALRTPNSAALAGIAFAVLLTVAIVLIQTAIPADPSEAGAWIADDTQRKAVVVALWLVPFAGIAFLWFIGVVRDRVGDAEDRFFATVFLGSGLLFIAMLFASAASAAALVESAETDRGRLFASGAWEVGRHMAHDLLSVYAMRMAAVFTIATSTILMRTGRGPRRISVGGYAIAIVMLARRASSPGSSSCSRRGCSYSASTFSSPIPVGPTSQGVRSLPPGDATPLTQRGSMMESRCRASKRTRPRRSIATADG